MDQLNEIQNELEEVRSDLKKVLGAITGDELGNQGLVVRVTHAEEKINFLEGKISSAVAERTSELKKLDDSIALKLETLNQRIGKSEIKLALIFGAVSAVTVLASILISVLVKAH